MPELTPDTIDLVDLARFARAASELGYRDHQQTAEDAIGRAVPLHRTDRLSRAASEIWRFRMAEPDPMGDPSGDCGDLIAAHERGVMLRAVANAGYATPGEYNNDLRSRLVNADGTMSYRVHNLLSVLEVEDVCPSCGAALDVSSHWTRNYGGGWDTFYKCPACGHGEVYV
jgi:predicted RNA-binding Zn-ribbon protein involved in translation (DUF1610 family)